MPRAQDALFTFFENERDGMNHHNVLRPCVPILLAPTTRDVVVSLMV